MMCGWKELAHIKKQSILVDVIVQYQSGLSRYALKGQDGHVVDSRRLTHPEGEERAELP